MTDKELLELAAKAIGENPIRMIDAGMLLDGIQDPWHPLENDGDALRLAVNLHFSVFSNETASWVAYGNPQIAHAEVHHGGVNPYAATRRAIVRAAAEIGRGL